MNKKLKIANTTRLVFEFILNISIILMGIAATTWGFLANKGKEIEFCKWFTNQSNWLMILSCIVYFIFLIIKTSGRIDKIPQGIVIFQLTGIVAAAVTLFGVLFFLIPRRPSWDYFANFNIFFHLLLPVFGLLTFLLTEHAPHTKFRYLWICIIPMDAYLIYYFAMYLKDGSDWYGIIGFLGKASPLAFVVMAGFQFLIGWLLWLGNRYIHFGYPRPQPYFKWHKK